ncbi:MAG: glycosyltransferase [Actinobacteria bacterium]|nr:glycosyltransferase [Actinomycetota bacterium]
MMTTFNGERFLVDQLNSLRLQTQQPEEVLIFDDKSTDKTTGLIEEYIARHQLHNWKLHRNTVNLGWRQNFMNGFMQASQDIVFPCDQDDVWALDKIETMTSVIKSNAQVELLCCRYTSFSEVDPSWRPTRLRESNRVRPVVFGSTFEGIRRPGCTFCFRRAILEDATQHWRPSFAHDSYIWLYCWLKGSLYLLDYEGVHYRRHSTNNTPPAPKSRTSATDEMALMIDYLKAADKILWRHKDRFSNAGYHRRQHVINRTLRFYSARLGVVSTGGFFNWLTFLGRYPVNVGLNRRAMIAALLVRCVVSS